jgi:hypothetical protein
VEMGDEAAETAELAGTTSLTFVVSPTLTWMAAAASSPFEKKKKKKRPNVLKNQKMWHPTSRKDPTNRPWLCHITDEWAFASVFSFLFPSSYSTVCPIKLEMAFTFSREAPATSYKPCCTERKQIPGLKLVH